MLVRRADQAGYVGVTPHQFRHTFSVDWLESGVRGRPNATERLDIEGDGRPVRR